MRKTRERQEIYEQHAFDEVGNYREPRRLYTPEHVVQLQKALEPFLDVSTLRRCVAEQHDVYEALRCDSPPREVRHLLDALVAILRPIERMQVRSPADVAGYLMLQMGALPQEELWTVLLDTKNRMMGTTVVYRGSLNASMVRISEVYREAVKQNSAAIIVAHQHPSGDPTPSPEDVLVTREIVAAGKLLGIDCLDHLVLGRGRWLSMMEKRMGFDKP